MQRNVEKFGISDKRGRTPKNIDPYVMEDALREPAICQNCHALYLKKRWQFDPQSVETLQGSRNIMWVTCPACAKIEENYPEGIVILRGDYFWLHEDEIRNLVSNEAQASFNKNPLARIMKTVENKDEIIIETTEQKLAEHLGRALKGAHSGELKVTWSKSPRVCRVVWERWGE